MHTNFLDSELSTSATYQHTQSLELSFSYSATYICVASKLLALVGVVEVPHGGSLCSRQALTQRAKNDRWEHLHMQGLSFEGSFCGLQVLRERADQVPALVLAHLPLSQPLMTTMKFPM